MATIHPFKPIKPQPNHEAEMSCPPYDVISTAEARVYADNSPNNYVRVIRSEVEFPDGTDPHGSEVYEKSRDVLASLIAEGALQEGDEPTMFVYRLVHEGRRQVGLVCTVDAAEYRDGSILKHEKTRPDKEDDRTQHILTLGAHAEPILLSWRDNDASDPIVDRLHAGMSDRPFAHFVADNVTHTLWKIENAAQFSDLFASVPALYIADGHHRSAAGARAASACEQANPSHVGDEEYNRILAVIFPESHLTILPYNRVVRDLNGLSSMEFLERLRAVGTLSLLKRGPYEPATRGTVNVFVEGAWHALQFDPASIERTDPIASLDVALLQDRVLGSILGVGDPRLDTRIGFVGGIRGTSELEARVTSGEWAAAFSMYPTSMAELLQVAEAGMIMPPKSTWFEPKLRSGLFLHRFDVPEPLSQ